MILPLIGPLLGQVAVPASPPKGIDELMLHEIRRRILKVIESRPGSSITDVRRQADVSWSSVQHHLYILERAGLVESVSDGPRRALFAPTIDRTTRVLIATLRHPIARALARAVAANPGINQKEICVQVGITRRVFRRQANRLIGSGLIQEVAQARTRIYLPSPVLEGRYAGVLAENGPPGAAPAPDSKPR